MANGGRLPWDIHFLCVRTTRARLFVGWRNEPGRSRRHGGSWRSPLCSTAPRERRPPKPAGWTARPCETGSSGSTNRACDLIMRLYAQFGISVSDDTVYRALKELGFSHVTARPKAHKQNAEVIEAFKKISRPVWWKSSNRSRRAHR